MFNYIVTQVHETNVYLSDSRIKEVVVVAKQARIWVEISSEGVFLFLILWKIIWEIITWKEYKSYNILWKHICVKLGSVAGPVIQATTMYNYLVHTF